MKIDISSVSPSLEQIHETLFSLFLTLSDIRQIPVHQAKFKLNAGALKKVQQLCFQCQFKDLMVGYDICCFVIFFHSVCTTSSTITPTWRAWLLLQPGWFRGCLWFIWHSKPGYCISITWSHGIIIMMHFTITIVLPVKHVIQYGLKHSRACPCDCSESQVAWILDGFAI